MPVTVYDTFSDVETFLDTTPQPAAKIISEDMGTNHEYFIAISSKIFAKIRNIHASLIKFLRLSPKMYIPTVATLYKIAAAMGMTVELRPL